ncbi:MAG: protein phosphatase 2C domain-containing protein [Actinobacteria bacterium]|nr:protein phosphatase 2C domain-containing protein [Actinomycetota bacterium]
MSAQAFWVVKAGNSDSEYEDAYCPKKSPRDQDKTCFRFAVADGATETSFSGIWAKQLVRSFCNDRLDVTSIGGGLRDLQQRWSMNVRRRPLPWYAEEKVRIGAFAALLGVALHDDSCLEDPHEWRAIGLGDSCLVQMRGEEVLVRFPLDNSASFTNRPHLLSSNPAYNRQVIEHLCSIKGTWDHGDVFYLMTDALACWFMREVEEGRRPWSILRDVGPYGEIKPFREWVGELRADRAIRNDDVTLLRVVIE